MNQTTTIPITIAPEAAEHVQKLGMQREFDQMVEHVRQTAPDLRSLEVTLEPPYDTGDEDWVVITALRDNPHSPNDPTNWQWREWARQSFPPDVWRRIVMDYIYLPES